MTKYSKYIATRLQHLSDPMGIRKSTAWIIRHARFVHLDTTGIDRMKKLVQTQIRNQILLTESQFGEKNIGPQRVFLQDVVNFCFWAPKGASRWEVEYPEGNRLNGWFALVACFERALAEGVPILDAQFLAQFTLSDARSIFRGIHDDVPIPLLSKRHEFLKLAGSILSKKWRGSIEHFMTSLGPHAGNLIQAIVINFPFFDDTAIVHERRIFFYKRAQICIYDLSLLPDLTIHHADVLTAFADYKLPQILRHWGAIHYAQQLSHQVDSMVLIPRGSQEEIELRAATIWVVELIAQELGVPAALIDNALWQYAATSKRVTKPYHRTLTTSY